MESRQSQQSFRLDQQSEQNIPSVKVDDLALWKAFKSGSESAFISIYNQYFHQLYQFGFQFLDDKEAIKDLIQDLFIEIRKNRASLSSTDSIKLYLFKSIKRKIFRFLKNRNRFQFVHEFPFEFTHHIEHTIIQHQLNSEKIAALNARVKCLTARQREVIYYYFYENLSYEQIRELMGFTKTRAARNLLYRAIKELRKDFPKIQ